MREIPTNYKEFKEIDIYLVGGAVRDRLLGLTVVEKDYVVVGAKPQQMIKWGFEQIGKDFPVFLHPVSHEEYALARTERKTGKGYHQFDFDIDTVSLEEDLLRRDLTINAIAEDESGHLIDPFNGQKDIADKKLRHVSEAFLEDPVRLLRVARFAARFHHLGFSIADETMALMKEMVINEEVNALVPERVCAEMFKALDSQSPHVFFEVLRACGALKIIFPEVDALFGVPQRADYHPEIDTGKHVMMCLENTGKRNCSRLTKFGVLCHDLGKAKTDKALLPRHHGHEKKGETPTKQLCNRLKVPNKYTKLAVNTAIYHSHIHRFNELKSSTILDLFKVFGVDKDLTLFAQFVDACISDAKGRLGFEESDYPQAKVALKLAYQYQQFDSKPFVSKSLTGKEIGEAIRVAKIQFIRNQKQSIDDTFN